MGNKNLDKVCVLLWQWRNTLYREIQEDSHKKQAKAREFFPKPEEIKEFDNSQIIIMATRTLENSLMVHGFKINTQHFCLVRDYLLTSLILDNASRPGAIGNMTLHEFSRAKRQNHGYVVSVKRHKTGYKGPANIACSKKVFTQLTNYLNGFRSKLEGIGLAPNEKVFVSWNGGAMTSSLITMQMGSFWRRAMGNQEAKINPTLVRKYTTTVVHENMSESKPCTANLLCHSLGMADKKYAIFDKEGAAATGVKLKKVQRSSFDEKNSSYEDIPLQEIFKGAIRKGNIKTGDVREIVWNNEIYFRDFSVDEKYVKKVLDSVRYIIQCNSKKSASTSGPKNCQGDQENIGIGTVNENDKMDNKELRKLQSRPYLRVRKSFSSPDMTLIYKHLNNFIDSDEPLQKNEFSNYTSKKNELKDLVAKFGINS